MYSLKTPPSEISGVLTQELFDKAQRYGLDKTRYALLKAVFNQILAFLLIRYKAYSRTWDAAGRFMDAFGLGADRTVRYALRPTGRRADTQALRSPTPSSGSHISALLPPCPPSRGRTTTPLSSRRSMDSTSRH